MGDTKQALAKTRGSKVVNNQRIRKTLIDAMRLVVKDNILACNNYELWYLVNKELPEDEKISFRDWLMIRNPLTIRARPTIKLSEYYAEAREIVIEALIEAKRELLVKYQGARNYIELRKCEFILQTRFKDWGVDIGEEQDVADVPGTVYNIVVNNHNPVPPVHTEREMLLIMGEDVTG